MDARAALADVAGLGDFFAVSTDPAEQVDPTWRPMAELYADPQPLRDRIAHVRRVLGSDDRVAASIALQGFAARLLSAPFAATVLHGVLPDLTPQALHWRPSATGPWPLWCDDPSGTPVDGPDEAVRALDRAVLADHLAPLIAAVRAQVPVSERLLWGNVASAVAGGKRLLVADRPAAAECAAAVAAGLLDSGPLAGAGVLRAPEGPDRVVELPAPHLLPLLPPARRRALRRLRAPRPPGPRVNAVRGASRKATFLTCGDLKVAFLTSGHGGRGGGHPERLSRAGPRPP